MLEGAFHWFGFRLALAVRVSVWFLFLMVHQLGHKVIGVGERESLFGTPGEEAPHYKGV